MNVAQHAMHSLLYFETRLCLDGPLNGQYATVGEAAPLGYFPDLWPGGEKVLAHSTDLLTSSARIEKQLELEDLLRRPHPNCRCTIAPAALHGKGQW